ncbi:MAG: 50S ribosomal protein L30 [Candidatus Aenigmatarchaeota archaeon]|nr:50S ribosomal protein L30 [Candidatus Aenigmarchaeota archaeon]
MLAVIRISGQANLRRDIRDTLKMLRLDAPYNCVFVPETPDYKGMVKKVENYVTYGEVEKQTLVEVLKKRLRTIDNKRIVELKPITGYNSYEELADDLMSGKVKLSQFKVKPVIKLTPPSKGFKSIKQNYPEGDLGYRGNEINELLMRMI